jgi:hypothetical protein
MVPSKYYNAICPLWPLLNATGTLVCYLLGSILPNDENTEELLKTNRWLVIYVYVPLIFFIVSLLCMFLILKEDSLIFLIQVDDSLPEL